MTMSTVDTLLAAVHTMTLSRPLIRDTRHRYYDGKTLGWSQPELAVK